MGKMNDKTLKRRWVNEVQFLKNFRISPINQWFFNAFEGSGGIVRDECRAKKMNSRFEFFPVFLRRRPRVEKEKRRSKDARPLQ